MLTEKDGDVTEICKENSLERTLRKYCLTGIGVDVEINRVGNKET